MNIALVQAYNNYYKELAELVTPNKQSYAIKHGYEFIDKKVVWKDTRNGAWIIPVTLQELVSEKYKHIDWFYWTDVDSLIMDQNVKLENIIKNVDSKIDFVASLWTNNSDKSYSNLKGNIEVTDAKSLWFMIHTGNFFVRNSEFSRKFLYTICEDQRYLRSDLQDVPGWDEFAFTLMFLAYPEMREHFLFLPNEQFISFDYNLFKYKEHGSLTKVETYTEDKFIIHFPLLPVEQRIELTKKFLNKVIV